MTTSLDTYKNERAAKNHLDEQLEVFRQCKDRLNTAADALIKAEEEANAAFISYTKQSEYVEQLLTKSLKNTL